MEAESGQVRVVTYDTFPQEVLQSSIPVLVAFWAPGFASWPTCASVLREVSDELRGRVIIATVDTDAEPKLTRIYDVASLPAFHLYRKGEVVKKLSHGILPKARLLDELRPHLD
jgi:thioredoxin-like negative regulator of GroEL